MKNSQEIYSYTKNYLRSGAYSYSHNEFSVPCPKCGKDNKHFSVNIRTGLYNCFKCGLSGSIRDYLLQDREKWSSLAGYAQPKIPKIYSAGSSSLRKPISAIIRGELCIRDLMEYSIATNAMKYCLKRGVTKEQITKYQICIEMYSPRVWFPFWDDTGKISYWFGRAFNNDVEPKILNDGPEDLPLFGRHIMAEQNDVVLVEGIFDHLVTPHSYALLGSNITGSQILQLRDDDAKRIFLILDTDASDKAINVAQKISRFGFKVWPVIIIGDKKDPAEIGRPKMTEITDNLFAKTLKRPQVLYAYL